MSLKIASVHNSLVSGFLQSAASYPDRPALFVDEITYSYSDMVRFVLNIAKTLENIENHCGLAGVFAHKSLCAYTGILASLYCGLGYVPLNPAFPIERNKRLIRKSEIGVILTDTKNHEALLGLLNGFEKEFKIIVLDWNHETKEKEGRFELHYLNQTAQTSLSVQDLREPEVLEDQIAYLLFTSGSTGEPKGVGITHRNILHLLDVMVKQYGFNYNDRFTQPFDFTFDFSVFCIFAPWQVGGALYSVPKKQCIAPGSFVQEHSISIWSAVPSTISFLARFGLLRPNAFPAVRFSFFCGEPLHQESVCQFAISAPNSKIENLYGPTEATVFFTYYRWDPQESPAKCVNGIVPIGKPFPGLEVTVVGNDLVPVPAGKMGELCLAGPQVAPGYWKNQDLTRERFVSLNIVMNKNVNYWYRTGDLAKFNQDNDLIFLGRVDEQVQIAGYRVELGEIEHLVREITGIDQVAAICYSLTRDVSKHIAVFLCGSRMDTKSLKALCADRMPAYMVPKEFHFIEQMPINDNGKVDKKQLKKMRMEE